MTVRNPTGRNGREQRPCGTTASEKSLHADRLHAAVLDVIRAHFGGKAPLDVVQRELYGRRPYAKLGKDERVRCQRVAVERLVALGVYRERTIHAWQLNRSRYVPTVTLPGRRSRNRGIR